MRPEDVPPSPHRWDLLDRFARWRLRRHFARYPDLPDTAEGWEELREVAVSTGWYCVSCGAERPRNPAVTCPRPGCGMKSYGSRPPANPVMPPPPDDRAGER